MRIIHKIGYSYHRGIKYIDYEFRGISGAWAIYIGFKHPFIDIIRLPF